MPTPPRRSVRPTLVAVGNTITLTSLAVIAACGESAITGPADPAALAASRASRGSTSTSTSSATSTSSSTSSSSTSSSSTSTSSTSTSTSTSTSSTSTGGKGSARVTSTITVGPNTTATWTFNGNRLRLVAGSICDPATSTYGPGEWDRPCEPLTRPIQVTLTSWRGADGRMQVKFTPDLRFVPGSANTLSLFDRVGAARRGVVAWCPSDGAACVDESRDDPSLAATHEPSSGLITRRIKHFSGFTVLVD